MASLTYTLARMATRRRVSCAPDPAVFDAEPAQDAQRGTRQARCDDKPVWNWAESAVLSGYGPPASAFL